MNIRQSIRIALHALTANKLRAALTMLGIIIGVGAVVGLLSVGQGAQDAIMQEIQGIGSNLIFVMPGSLSTGTAFSRSVSSDMLTLGDAEALAKSSNCPNCAAVAPQYDHTAEIVYRSESVVATITGTTPEYQKIRNYDPASGQFFTAQDNSTGARVVVLGADVAEQLFDTEEPLGKIVRINRIPFRVTGILAKRGTGTFGDTRDQVVLVPLTTASRLFRRDTTVGSVSDIITMINISAVDEAHIENAIDDITQALRTRHKIVNDQDDFSVTSQKDIMEVTSSVTKVLTTFLAAIAAISLLVGGIGIMNIMLVSVMERTREIGLRKAIGARGHDILIQFLIEAVILSLAGGFIGIATGALISAAVDLTGVFNTSLSFQAVVLAVGFSAAVGLFFGIYPARRAARLNPIDALRYE